jgi:hypothetical protein
VRSDLEKVIAREARRMVEMRRDTERPRHALPKFLDVGREKTS